jgi:hypothetical protein
MKKLSSIVGANTLTSCKFFAILSALALLLSHPAQATTYTWTNGDADGFWIGPNNWSPAGVPGVGDTANLTSSLATINGGSSDVIDLFESDSVGVLNIGDSVAGSGLTYTLEDGAGGGVGNLTLNNGGLGASINESATSSSDIISAPIIMADSLAITSASTTGHTFTISGGITSTGTENLTLQANAAGVITLSTAAINNSGTITNSGIGTGTVTISGGIGSNVTAVNQNSSTSALAITGALAVNGSGTTINSNGTAATTISGA